MCYLKTQNQIKPKEYVLNATRERAAVENIRSLTVRKKAQSKSAVEVVERDGAQEKRTGKNAFRAKLLVSKLANII